MSYDEKLEQAQQFLLNRGITDPLPIANGPPLDFQAIEARVLAWREKELANAA